MNFIFSRLATTEGRLYLLYLTGAHPLVRLVLTFTRRKRGPLRHVKINVRSPGYDLFIQSLQICLCVPTVPNGTRIHCGEDTASSALGTI